MGRVEWPPLVERETELGAIDAAVARVDEGVGAFLLFDGEPGIGKSALLHELIKGARARHVKVLSARGTPIEQDVPFGVELQLFAPVLEAASAQERERLLAGPAALAASLLSGGEAQGAGSLQGLRWLAVRLARRVGWRSRLMTSSGATPRHCDSCTRSRRAWRTFRWLLR